MGDDVPMNSDNNLLPDTQSIPKLYERIKFRRKEIGISAEEVAEKLNVSPATIYRYEKNDIKKFPTDILKPLAEVLCTTPEYLLGWTENISDNNSALPIVNNVEKVATFSDRLNEALEARGVKAADLSRSLDIDEGTISNYRKGKYEPKQIRMQAISSYLNVSALWLMGADVPMENIIPLSKLKTIPLLKKITDKKFILAQENWDETVLLPENVSADFALKCKGDSMIDARIYDGDIVYIKSQSQADNGSIVAVLIDNEATLKRFYRPNDNTVILQPENKNYQPMVFVGNEISKIRIIGKATYFLSEIN